MGQLDGKVAVITGAGSGMAKASVKVFAREGAKVVAADVSGAEKDTAAEVGEGVLPVHCDVTKEDDIEAAVAGKWQSSSAVSALAAPVRATHGPGAERDGNAGIRSTRPPG